MTDSPAVPDADAHEPNGSARPFPEGRRPVTPTGPIGVVGGTSVPFYAPRRCPPGAPCEPETPRRVHVPGRYDAEQLNHSEAATLAQAVVEADEDLNGARPAIDGAVQALVLAEGGMVAAHQEIDGFVLSNRLLLAYRAVEQVRLHHEQDGPEDRRHRPQWVKWALWLGVGAASVYDTVYFAEIFAQLIDSRGGPSDPQFYVGLLPGVLIAIALVVTGHWLAQAILRARAHRERRPRRLRLGPWIAGRLGRREPVLDERRDGDLPWPRWGLALSFALLVLGTMGVWAVIRGDDTVKATPVAYGLLLLLFTIAAVAVKVVHYNPYYDSSLAAERALHLMQKERERLVTLCNRATSEYAGAESRLVSLINKCEGQARQRLHRAWIQILRDRGEHGLAGDVAPDFAEPRNTADADPRSHTQPMFERVTEPRVELGPVQAARTVLDHHDVDAARQRCRQVIEALNTQTRGTGFQPTPGGAGAEGGTA